MEDNVYRNIRKIFFWLFFLIFIIVLPLIIFYSLGYQFNRNLKRFQRTGIISIRSLPTDAEIYLNDKKINKETPFDIRNLLPNTYKIRLEKEGFYPYELNVEVKPFFVSVVDATLIPRIKDIEKIKEELSICNFFVIESFFGKKIVVLAKEGIFIFNEDLEELAKANLDLDTETLSSIKNIKEGKNRILLYNINNIWTLDYSLWGLKKDLVLEHIYKTDEEIKDVFFGFRDKYLIIQEKSKIVALDIKNKIIFDIYKLNSSDAKVYYDSSSDTLFIKDKIFGLNTTSLFKINISKKIYEKVSD